MAGSHLSIRVDDSIIHALDAESRRLGRTRSELAKTLLVEGLRMQAHPGIIFRPGPTGRRPGLIGGPDIWEIATVIVGLARDENEEVTVERIAELTFLSPDRVNVALRYYAEYQDEIDEWLRRVDEASERRKAAWLREQAILQS